MDLFLHGHVPGKNTITRVHPRKDAAKPARRPEPVWDAETNAVFLRTVFYWLPFVWKWLISPYSFFSRANSSSS